MLILSVLCYKAVAVVHSLISFFYTFHTNFCAYFPLLQVLVNEEIGYWLARILYSHNPARSDSAKIAGVMELFRVQVNYCLCLLMSFEMIMSLLCSFSCVYTYETQNSLI